MFHVFEGTPRHQHRPIVDMTKPRQTITRHNKPDIDKNRYTKPYT